MSQVSIGNDLVDLQSEESALHPRFIARVFSNSELPFVNQNPKNLWLNWSAKEAAYKALKRLDPEVIFSPIKFEYNPTTRVVAFNNITVNCRHEISEEFVYTYCATNSEILNLKNGYNWVEKKAASSNPSDAVRELAKIKIANILQVTNSDIEISNSLTTEDQSKNSIPKLFVNKLPSNNLLSFSHHGRFVACYFLKINK